LIAILLVDPRGFPDVIADIDLSSGDEVAHLPASDVRANPKVPAVDDVGNVGAISAKAITPGPVVDDAPKKPQPSATDQVSHVPTSGRRG
jgi:hypothetical protein